MFILGRIEHSWSIDCTEVIRMHLTANTLNETYRTNKTITTRNTCIPYEPIGVCGTRKGMRNRVQNNLSEIFEDEMLISTKLTTPIEVDFMSLCFNPELFVKV